MRQAHARPGFAELTSTSILNGVGKTLQRSALYLIIDSLMKASCHRRQRGPMHAPRTLEDGTGREKAYFEHCAAISSDKVPSIFASLHFAERRTWRLMGGRTSSDGKV